MPNVTTRNLKDRARDGKRSQPAKFYPWINGTPAHPVRFAGKYGDLLGVILAPYFFHCSHSWQQIVKNSHQFMVNKRFMSFDNGLVKPVVTRKPLRR
ncbi:MAG: hypothetical protein WBO17_03055, partial [Sphingorhabdus sp.]